MKEDLRRRALALQAAAGRLYPSPATRRWKVEAGSSGDHGGPRSSAGDACPLVGGRFYQFGPRGHVVGCTIDCGAQDLENATAIALVCNGVAQGTVAELVDEIDRLEAPKLRPMSEAPVTGPVVEILVATRSRAGCRGWLIVHYAEGGGEEQPRFRGWFYWTGSYFAEADAAAFLGWLPLPDARTATPP